MQKDFEIFFLQNIVLIAFLTYSNKKNTHKPTFCVLIRNR